MLTNYLTTNLTKALGHVANKSHPFLSSYIDQNLIKFNLKLRIGARPPIRRKCEENEIGENLIFYYSLEFFCMFSHVI